MYASLKHSSTLKTTNPFQKFIRCNFLIICSLRYGVSTLVTVKMDTLLFFWTLLTVPPCHLLLGWTGRPGTWNLHLQHVSICTQLPCMGLNQVCWSMLGYNSSCFLPHMWAVQMPWTSTSPRATGCLHALQVVNNHTAHTLDFTQTAAFKAIPDIPQEIFYCFKCLLQSVKNVATIYCIYVYII